MSIMAQAQKLAQEGAPGDAVVFVTKAADEGDPEAMFALANWRLWGLYGPQRLEECHALLAKASAAGWAEASHLRATLIGNGTGVASDPQKAAEMLRGLAGDDPGLGEQLTLFEKAMEEADLARLECEWLSKDPEIRIIRSFLTGEECDYVLKKAKPMLRPSLIVDPNTRRPRPHPTRTSSGMSFDPAQEDLLIHAINKRIAVATGTGVTQGEPLQILCYAPGQEYLPHIDAIPGATNQRHLTALIYLNEDYEGGETTFTELDIQARGQRGDCLIFRNASEEGVPDPRTKHAGLPVTAGQKWLASRWIRVAPYTPEVMR